MADSGFCEPGEATFLEIQLDELKREWKKIDGWLEEAEVRILAMKEEIRESGGDVETIEEDPEFIDLEDFKERCWTRREAMIIEWTEAYDRMEAIQQQ